ncbi:MAG: AmmeMemoRadiSam system protein A [Ignavibacteriaceae bacterium]
MKLSESEKGVLILAAREAIQSLFLEIISPIIDYTYYPNLKEKRGAFVTLIQSNKLRGCIGYLQSDMSLFETVCEAAKQSAVNDPRFPPVTYDEISKIFVEISVLSPLEKISNYEQIELGVHGLMLEEGQYRSVLLPQVAVEHNYNHSQFLNALCEKAGLPPFAWENDILNIKVFTAEVFSEMGNRKRTYERI